MGCRYAAAAVQELGLKNHVIIVGMDAELAAVKRLVAGTQDATVYMDLKIWLQLQLIRLMPWRKVKK